MLSRLLFGACVVVVGWVGCGGSTADDAFGPNGGDGGANDGASDARDGGDGATPYDTSCSGPGECVLGEPGCCGVGCSEPTVSSYVAIHRGQAQALKDATCTEPNPTCPGCAAIPNPNLQAFCRQKKCVVVDVRNDEVSSCRSDDDCTLRPAACCPCGDVATSELIAIAKAAGDAYRKQVCDPQAACPKCPWQLPTNARARCNGSRKHCEVDVN